MEQILDYLSLPIVGSLIGIIGIIVGATLTIIFYFKAKFVSKPCYSIENTSLIDLSLGEIPSSVTMNYADKKIRRLNKTVIQFWNAGKKPIMSADLSPQYIQIPFNVESNPDLQIFSVKATTTREQIVVTSPVITENKNVRFEFNFLEKGDKITITILHTSADIPTTIDGYVIGVPKGFINVTERQRETRDLLIDVILESYGGVAANIVDIFAKTLSKFIK